MGCNGWSSCWGPAENLAYDFFCLGLAHDDTWWMCKYEKEWLFVVLQWTWCLGFLHQRWDPLNESEKSTIFIKQNEEDWFIRFQARHQLFDVNKSQTLLWTLHSYHWKIHSFLEIISCWMLSIILELERFVDATTTCSSCTSTSCYRYSASLS